MEREEIKNLLMDLVDGALAPDQVREVEAGLDQHPDLKQELEDLREAIRLAGQLTEVEIPPELTEGIRGAVNAARTPKTSPVRLLWPLGAAAAAVLVLAVAFALHHQENTAPRSPESSMDRLVSKKSVGGDPTVQGEDISPDFMEDEIADKEETESDEDAHSRNKSGDRSAREKLEKEGVALLEMRRRSSTEKDAKKPDGPGGDLNGKSADLMGSHEGAKEEKSRKKWPGGKKEKEGHPEGANKDSTGDSRTKFKYLQEDITAKKKKREMEMRARRSGKPPVIPRSPNRNRGEGSGGDQMAVLRVDPSRLVSARESVIRFLQGNQIQASHCGPNTRKRIRENAGFFVGAKKRARPESAIRTSRIRLVLDPGQEKKLSALLASLGSLTRKPLNETGDPRNRSGLLNDGEGTSGLRKKGAGKQPHASSGEAPGSARSGEAAPSPASRAGAAQNPPGGRVRTGTSGSGEADQKDKKNLHHTEEKAEKTTEQMRNLAKSVAPGKEESGSEKREERNLNTGPGKKTVRSRHRTWILVIESR